MREVEQMFEMPVKFSELSEIYTRHFDIVRADTPALLDRVYELRYQVYCVENEFEDPAKNLGGREIDADDDRAAHILLMHRESGAAAGTARVIFPDHRRLLPIQRVLDTEGRRLFGHLPAHSVGEVSRFAVPKAFRRRRGEDRYADAGMNAPAAEPDQRVMPFITFGLFRGIIGVCLESGLSHMTAVMEAPLIRLLSRFGLDFHAIGGVVEYHGLRQPCVAPVFDLIEQVRSKNGTLWLYAKEEVTRYTASEPLSTAQRIAREPAALPIDE
jgi:N-acyl amino acid synthase of PEP-CTERM/exosortase system